jgi:hypothetical protein
MSEKTIDTLRDHLFDAMTAMKEGKLTIEQAKCISELGQVIVNSAKVEADYVRANGGGESRFISATGGANLPAHIAGPNGTAALPPARNGVYRHLLADD